MYSDSTKFGGKCAQVANRQVLTKFGGNVCNRQVLTKLNQVWADRPKSTFDQAQPKLGESVVISPKEYFFDQAQPSLGESILRSPVEYLRPSSTKFGGKCTQIAHRVLLTELNQVWGKVYSDHPSSTFNRGSAKFGGKCTRIAQQVLLTELNHVWGKCTQITRPVL